MWTRPIIQALGCKAHQSLRWNRSCPLRYRVFLIRILKRHSSILLRERSQDGCISWVFQVADWPVCGREAGLLFGLRDSWEFLWRREFRVRWGHMLSKWCALSLFLLRGLHSAWLSRWGLKNYLVLAYFFGDNIICIINKKAYNHF